MSIFKTLQSSAPLVWSLPFNTPFPQWMCGIALTGCNPAAPVSMEVCLVTMAIIFFSLFFPLNSSSIDAEREEWVAPQMSTLKQRASQMGSGLQCLAQSLLEFEKRMASCKAITNMFPVKPEPCWESCWSRSVWSIFTPLMFGR